MIHETLLTTEEAMVLLQVNIKTIYRLIKSSELRAIRVGRQWRFSRRDIDAWLRTARGRRVSGVKPSPRRVLIVDDEESARALLSETFKEARYDVDTAESAPSAIQRLREAEYDLLVTDLQMPGMGGLALIREARRKASSVELPIVIITGRSTEASAIEAINLGVSGYLMKPFRMPQILSTAARALGDPEPAASSPS